MLPVNLDKLTPEDIQGVIDSEIAESLTLEYKEQLPTGQSEEKREFLYDVAAMANAAGGDILFGITDGRGSDKQCTGIADRFAGIKIGNEQSEISRLSNLIRDGIAPRIVGVSMHTTTCADGDVLVLRIPRSWNKPHMVTIGGVNKFYIRTATGKAPMSVNEIGRAFSEQRELREKIEQWKTHRLELVSAGKGPAKLDGEVVMLFHVIPISAFERGILRESWCISPEEKAQLHVPFQGTGERYNADGFLRFCDSEVPSLVRSYTQLFRSGIVEYADGRCSGELFPSLGPMIFGLELEREMINCYSDARNRFRRLGHSEGVYVGFSLLGIAGKWFYSTMIKRVAAHKTLCTVESFISPEVYVDPNEPEERPYSRTLLPLVDTMWQLGGLEGTPFRSANGWEPFENWQ
jgi:hypothetical protein